MRVRRVLQISELDLRSAIIPNLLSLSLSAAVIQRRSALSARYTRQCGSLSRGVRRYLAGTGSAHSSRIQLARIISAGQITGRLCDTRYCLLLG